MALIFKRTAAAPTSPIPNYAAPALEAITTTSAEIIPAGSGRRYATLSVATDAADVFISIGSAVNVGTNNYNFIVQAGDQIADFEITAQAYHAATQAGTANVVVAVTA